MERLKKFPAIIKGIIEAHPKVAFEWANFSAYGAYSLDFDVAYYVKNYEWYSFMVIREGIYLEIFRQFGEEGIEFAYPTQTLFMQQAAADRLPPSNDSVGR